jgi:hypothetical protein
MWFPLADFCSARSARAITEKVIPAESVPRIRRLILRLAPYFILQLRRSIRPTRDIAVSGRNVVAVAFVTAEKPNFQRTKSAARQGAGEYLALYRLSYTRHKGEQRDSNPQPLDYNSM